MKNLNLTVEDLADRVHMNFITASDHIRKLAQSGLVMKRHESKYVKHALTDKGKKIVKFLKEFI